MEPFVIFKYLHVVSMFFAVALALSTELVVRRVAATGDARTIRTVVPRVRPLGNFATAFFMGGLAFGIIAALAGQMNLLAPWLLMAYAAFIGATLIGVFVTDPWSVRLEAAAVANQDDVASDTLARVIADPIARAGTWALMVLIAVLVFLMVVKPFA
ncbi:MAG: hypothetical protein M3406_10395 [Chloroflexota bacterium]|nr:hypothetical protein [Chloroflexota bacterium]